MPVVISMLRGVNVASHNRIQMAPLRELYESLGLRDAKTYVQSGNVVFKTQERNLTALARRIEEAIERKFDFRPAVILRTTSELREAVARNPFAKRPDIHPGKLLVTFLAAEPRPEARDAVLAIKSDPEELRIDGREIYIYFPNGQGRSKLSWVRIEKMLNVPGTGRNWNSVTKLLAMAESFEA
jgi:uncharacterized protein (DUF1697 family)